MTARRAGAAGVLVVVLLLVVGSGPVQAAAPSGGITSPSNDAVLTTTTPTISGSYSMPNNGRVDEVKVVVTSRKTASMERVFPGNGGSTLAFSYTLPPLAYNGRYRATAQAKGTDAIETNGQETSAAVTRDFSVAVPPAQPTGLRSTPNSTKQQVSLTWNANPEPDMLGYEVQRQESGKSTWTSVAQIQAPQTSTVDTVPSPGDWKYRVVAIREGANETEGVASEPSAVTSTTVAPPPTTTTTTVKGATPPGGGSGGSGGGSSGGNEEGSGAGGAGGGATSRSGSGDRALARAGRVDLSSYGALLDANRRQLQTTPTTEYDPGFDENLPFSPVEAGAEEPDGGQSVEIGFTETRVTDEAAERRKMAYFAGSLLAFVLAMHGWFIRGEVRRQEELEALTLADGASEPESGPDRAEATPDPSGAEVLTPTVLSTPAAARARRRARREEARAAAPGAPTPASPAVDDGAGTVAAARGTQGGRRARRAARGVPPRPGHDPSEGVTAVRPRRRGAGSGDRRPAV